MTWLKLAHALRSPIPGTEGHSQPTASLRPMTMALLFTRAHLGIVLPPSSRSPHRLPQSGARRKTAQAEITYLEFNQQRMQYGTFRQQGYFIGSGVIEAGCKSVVGQRCKLSGMHWSVAGVDNVLDLRCLLSSAGLWDQFWKNRQEQKRARLATAT